MAERARWNTAAVEHGQLRHAACCRPWCWALSAILCAFRTGPKSSSLVGLDLSASQSGKSQGSPVVSKKGKSEIRYALYQAAMVASTRDKHFLTYFTDQLRGREKEPGIKTKKRVKLAAKMLMIAWTLMKKQEIFDPKYLCTTAQPIIGPKTSQTDSGGIPEVQPGAARRL